MNKDKKILLNRILVALVDVVIISFGVWDALQPLSPEVVKQNQETRKKDHKQFLVSEGLMAVQEIQNLVFVQNERSGLCFASYRLGEGNSSMGEVDCEKVKALLVPPPK